MVLVLLIFLLVAAVAFYQVIQGLFSALIMTVLTVLCVALAFCAYEPLAESLLYTRQPAYADMVMLTALWVLPLLVLRLLADKLIPGNVVFGVWANRILAAPLGVVTAVTLIGAVLVGAQMLPYGPSVLGYRPFDDSLRRTEWLAPFYPDDVVAGAAKYLSGGALQARGGFASRHDDLLLELFCARNTAGLDGRVDALPDALSVPGAYEPPAGAAAWSDEVPRDPLIHQGTPQRIVIVRAAVSESARDEDNNWRLPAAHFRLVADNGRSHYPLGYLTYWVKDKQGQPRPGDETWLPTTAEVKNALVQVALLVVQRPWQGETKNLVVDWVYRLPPDEKPAYMVFRRTAKAAVPEPGKQLPPAADRDGKPVGLDRISQEYKPPVR